MTAKKVAYLTIIVPCALGLAIGYIGMQLHPILYYLSYPLALQILCSCIRLYMFPGELFDPYTCLSKDDSAVFKRSFRIVYISSLFLWVAITYLVTLLWGAWW